MAPCKIVIVYRDNARVVRELNRMDEAVLIPGGMTELSG